ncbi:MAG: hypothetical protein MUE97_04425 [Phycisphaerales bacterium]|jgi:hypothetical protein|nr:hypothetical protein [Phycisphaerales bacterium]
MARARLDSSIQRHVVDGFDFPLGVYPVEDVRPIEGYTLNFESADSMGYDSVAERELDGLEDDGPGETAGDDAPDEDGDGPTEGGGGGGGGARSGRRGVGDERAGDEVGGAGGDGEAESWGQWPDRYVFDINIRASRVEHLCRMLWTLLPGRVYPILDVMGNDAYREIDPYIAYDLVGLERFLDGVRRFRGWLFEDGTVGFGAMSEEPFAYVFVDEHKIVTVRVDASRKEQVERVLAAFDLKEVEKIAGADAAVHEHRGVLDPDADSLDALSHEEIVEEVRDRWGLTLNVDPMSNPDEHGAELGVTAWRCVVRVFDEHGGVRYAEVLLTAPHLQAAGDLAIAALAQLDPALNPQTPRDDQEPSDYDVLWADRLDDDDLRTALGDRSVQLDKTHGSTIAARWMG